MQQFIFRPEQSSNGFAFLRKINIHNNPAKKGNVTIPEDWRYSSLSNWILDDNSIIQSNKDILFS